MLWPNGSRSKPNVSSPFGPRKVTQAGASSNHLGCDFTGFDTVRAIADGVVVWVGWRDGWQGGGYMVWIQHSGFLSRSLHMVDGSARVSIGDRVSEGQAIGTMGNTARPNPVGKHLHLEIVVNGVQINPEPFIAARLSADGSPAGAGSNTTPTNSASADTEEEESMKPFIVTLPGGRWALILPQGNAKPRAVSLQGNAGDAAVKLFGQPIPFDQNATTAGWLAQAVDGI